MSLTSSFNNNFNSKQYFNNMNFKLSWKNVSVWLKKKCNRCFWTLFEREEYLKILNNVSGVIYSGTLTVIIGTSGSGKTTLLTTISQRTKGIIVGEVFLNNKSISRNEMKQISGFLPQQEIATGYLTVNEHMHFMARLKMDETASPHRRDQNILIILTRLGLIDRAETKLSVLSGGELKKLSLAEQLITDPPFLFCDEPTTGLDSYNAENVVKILHDIANYGKAVICTIHQPTYGIFEIFDQVVLLVKGSVVYHGPTDKFGPYFSSIGLECPFGYNPVEYYVSHFAKNQNNAIYLQSMCDEFEKSIHSKELRRELKKYIYNTIVSNGSVSINNPNLPKTKQKLKFCIQLYWLLWRCFLNMKRSNKNIILRFVLYMFIALIISTMYWNIIEEFNQKDIQNLEGLIFLIITETIFTFTYSVLHTFPDELPKLLREISDDIFDPEPYYISKVISMIPLIIIETIFYSVLIFWSVSLNGGFFGFIYFYLPILFCALSSSAYGFALSTSFKCVATASLMSVPIEFLGMTYSGIYINIKNLSWLAFWFPYVSQFYYGIEAISIKQWENIHLQCENLDLPCLQTGTMVLEKYGFHEKRYILDLLGLLIYFFICHLIGFLSFKRKCRQEASY